MLRPTKIELEQRVSIVYQMLLRGDSRSQICAFAVQEWKISEGSVSRYIARATRWRTQGFEVSTGFSRKVPEAIAIQNQLQPWRTNRREAAFARAVQAQVQLLVDHLGLPTCITTEVEAVLPQGKRIDLLLTHPDNEFTIVEVKVKRLPRKKRPNKGGDCGVFLPHQAIGQLLYYSELFRFHAKQPLKINLCIVSDCDLDKFMRSLLESLGQHGVCINFLNIAPLLSLNPLESKQ